MLSVWLQLRVRVVDHTSDSKHRVVVVVVVDKANNYPFAWKHKRCIFVLGNTLHVQKGLTNLLLRYTQLQDVIPKGTRICAVISFLSKV